MLEAALTYLELLRSVQLRAIAEQTLDHAGDLTKMTADYARVGQGTEADADRAATEYAIRQNEVVRAEELIQTASARLVQLFSGDPQIFLRPMEPTVVPVELVPRDVTRQALVPTGLSNRLELAEARHLVGEAVQRYRREKFAPWLPSALLGVSYGGFGGGPGGDVDLFDDRFDFDAVAFWEIRNLGAGEKAARDEARARYQQSQAEQVRVMDRVAREIVEAHIQVEARWQQIGISEQAVERATASFDRNLRRIRDLQGLPIEALQSIQALDQARREYLRAVVDYNAAQFRLQYALGWPVSPDLAVGG